MAKKKAKKESTRNAVIYARYSSHNQREVSIEQQVEMCTALAKKKNLVIVDTYADKAMTGRNDNRPSFQKMMYDATLGKFDYVLAWKSNRMGRNMMEAMLNDSTLQDEGVKTVYVEEDFEDNAAGRFALRNMMNVNQFYSESMAEDVKRGMRDNAQKCMVNGVTPLGYKKGPDGKYAIDEPNAEIVRQIYQRLLEGWTISDLIDDLNIRGIKTRYGNEWSFKSFSKLLSHEQYIGVYKFADIRIENGIPPILDRETFEEVQKLMKEKKRPRGKQRENADYLLTGKCFCGKCGAPMIALAGTSRDGTKHCYYACENRRRTHTCDKDNVRKDDLEYSVAECVRKEICTPETVDRIVAAYGKVREEAQSHSRLKALQEELAGVEKTLGNIMKAIEAGLFNEMTKARMDELLEEKKMLEGQIKVEEAVFLIAPPEKVREWLEKMASGDLEKPEYMKELIRVFVRAVYVYDDKLIIQFNYGEEKEVPFGRGAVFAKSELSRAKVHLGEHRFYEGYFEVCAPILRKGTVP